MRSVLVTGGTVRIGAAISERLARDGWRVVTSSHRHDAGADVVADLSTAGGAERLFEAAKEFLGGAAPDAVVNNAALFDGPEDVVATLNFASPARLTELLAQEAPPRQVVNIVDSRVLLREPVTPYERSKARLLEDTRAAARRFAGRVRVNAVAPGPALASPLVREKAGPTPFGRPTPEAVADAVAFLLSAQYTTGCVIPVDGGKCA
ncbi:MAG: SDR family oxidoreductase [Kiritimatiellae bacterium]|nr:SDR family oxidoreductase [Kiritimatiellia bacterium]